MEVAHEALLWEWGRLAGWIEAHREDLRRQQSLATAAEEWESTDCNADYLITGSRLAEYETWSLRTTLGLTSSERTFLDSALERRRTERAEEDVRRDRQQRLERRATRRLRALAAALFVLIAAATVGVVAWLGSGPPDVALVYFGGDQELDIAAAAGFDRAASQLGIDAERVATPGSTVRAELRRQAERGVKLIVTDTGVSDPAALDAVAQDFPGTRFVTFDQVGRLANVTYVSYAEEEGSFLAGAAAALKSRTGEIGFIGGSDFDMIWRFHAGYEAGAHAIDPNIRVRAAYLTRPPDLSGFNSLTLARRAALRMYSGGADVIFHAAGWSGYGLFETARAFSRGKRKLWAIGVDTDQYRTISTIDPTELGISGEAVRQHVLTSMLKRFDRAAYLALAGYANGALRPGVQRLGLGSGGVGLAFSGGFIDDIRPRLDRLRKRIIAGDIEVPTVPDSRRIERE